MRDMKKYRMKASLTVEAAFVVPIFLYFMIAFLSFIQIFILQEEIQSGITKMGLSLSRTAYILEDFEQTADAENFDEKIFGMDYDIGLADMAKATVDGSLLRLYAENYLDTKKIDNSCVLNGYKGLNFFDSKAKDDNGCIDIVVSYKVRLPIPLFHLNDILLRQRVKVRGWTGYQIPAAYSTVRGDASDDPIVYITETGSVYHTNQNCSHIKLSVTKVIGIPSERRNDGGGKYYPCEACCNGSESPAATYYITSDGTRYHTRSDCPKIKRTVTEVHLSQVQGRSQCKRCAGNGG